MVGVRLLHSKLLSDRFGMDGLEDLTDEDGVKTLTLGIGGDGAEKGVIAVRLEHHQVVVALEVAHLTADGHTLSENLYKLRIEAVETLTLSSKETCWADGTACLKACQEFG